MIRPGKLDDLDQLVELGETFFAESGYYCEMGYAPGKLVNVLVNLIDGADGFCHVDEREGRLVGVMLGMCAQHWCSHALVATELGLFVLPRYRGGMTAARLVKAFVDWGRSKHCQRVVAGTSTGVGTEDCAKLYERLGFRRHSVGLEYSYVHGR